MVRVYTICYSQSDQCLLYLLFSTVGSGFTSLAVLSSMIRVYTFCHSFYTVLSRTTLFAILSNLISVYTISHSFYAVLSRSTLFAIYSSLIRVYTTSSLIRVYTFCHSQQSDQCLHYLPFSVWSGSTLFTFLSSLGRVYITCHSQPYYHSQDVHCHFQEQSDQGLFYMPFSAIWSRSALFAILSIMVGVYTICHYLHSDQGLQYLPL